MMGEVGVVGKDKMIKKGFYQRARGTIISITRNCSTEGQHIALTCRSFATHCDDKKIKLKNKTRIGLFIEPL